MRGEKILKDWLARKPTKANCSEAIAVMEALGMKVRMGGENHPIGFHPGLVDHPRYRHGMVTVNCHYRTRGNVHPGSIDDLVKAAKHLQRGGDNSNV